MNTWKSMDIAPKDGSEILCCFKGQFSWVIFIGRSYPQPYGVVAPGYAPPTHWMPLPSSPDID